ncbi:ammonium transporter [Symbiobacterium thermophilum]|uniref:Ammonium transporter n=1 Tax=Symbiobacterium thermophilum (strain DSM 24528 / JCM 14929 / IAM 14863 / T) TaxID=292459 RepID=Q67SX9_SYMTH|nr:ammonium transporter [Symbiobacterium thermophilum]BAD39214.1 ammonium transporter [Symbiobacterium thermophilum IAM 14863]
MNLDGWTVGIDSAWTMVAASLVFFMQAGFAMVEAGFTRSKNAVNIVLKNLMDFVVASIAFWAVGFGLMFGADAGGLVGLGGFGSPESRFLHLGLAIPFFVFLWFQTTFAGTAATIVSGAMAERTKFSAYLLFSAAITLLVYPVGGHWIWGGGWLAQLGFVDFAGSTVVHSVGAWAALAGLLLLGPRIDRYDKQGRPRKIVGHNLVLAALGVFILWFGWFGFNPGSTLSATDPNIGRIAVTTNLGAAAGALAALLSAYLRTRTWEAEAALNGALAGLVGITAGCAFVSPAASILIGAVAGMLLAPGTALLERFRIDDAVGAIPVHGFAGLWGTLAVGLFHETQGLLVGGGPQLLAIQALGAAAVFAYAFAVCLLIFATIKATVGLRVSQEEELSGLDTEHGARAYPDFQPAAAHGYTGDD